MDRDGCIPGNGWIEMDGRLGWMDRWMDGYGIRWMDRAWKDAFDQMDGWIEMDTWMDVTYMDGWIHG